MKKLVFVILFLFPVVVQSQDLIESQDLIIFRNGDQIDCKITRVDDQNLYYSFQRGEITINTYVNKNEVRSYKMSDQIDSEDSLNSSIDHVPEVIIDTSVFFKPKIEWVNLINFSYREGVHSRGFALQYFVYELTDKSKWIVPFQTSYEFIELTKSLYYNYRLNYFMIGVSPFRKLNDVIYLNLGAQALLGTEIVGSRDFNHPYFVCGFVASQGIYIIPKSAGLSLGIGIFEKVLTSETYRHDLGFKIDVGIKF